MIIWSTIFSPCVTRIPEPDMTDDELLPPSRFPSRICVLSNSLPQHPRIFVFGPSGLEVCFLMEPQSNGLSVNWNVFFTYPYMCSMPVDWISKIKSKLVVVLWLFRNSRNSFLFDLFLFCFPSVSVCCSRYYYYYYFSIPISMCRRRWWLALNNDDKAPDSPLLDTSWFVPIRLSIQLCIHPSVQQPISLSRRLDYWFIVCFLGLCRTGKRERNRHGYAKRSAHRNVSRTLLFVSPATMQIHIWSARFSISYVVVINLTTTTSSDNKRAQKN